MNQKQVGDTIFIPQKYRTNNKAVLEENTPEDLIFDKAEEAEGIEKKKELLAEVEKKIAKGNEELKTIDNHEQKQKLEKKLEQTKVLKEKIADKIDEKVDELDNSV